MDNIKNINNNYKCNFCNKLYSSYKSLWNHNKEFHNKNIEHNNSNKLCDNIKKYYCSICNKNFNDRSNKWKHEKKCTVNNNNNNNNNNNKIEQLEEKNKILKETINELKTQPSINNQLINLIVNKTNTIEELKTKIDENKTNNKSLIEINNTQLIIKLNDIDVIARPGDNYINATQLCQVGDKLFNDWFNLDTTKQMLNEAVIDIGCPISQLINESEKEIWIHPDLAIHLTYWVSPFFALKISKWIRSLFTYNIKILEDKNKEIEMKDNKIKLLENLCIKKQQRKDYPEKYVIYILTTEDNKKKGIYIVGKATKLKNRLSNYNKTSEHEVVYYKSCKSEEDMNVIELMVINKLKDYKEKANRDRFILPIEKDITFFTDIIDKSIEFYK